MSGSRDDNDKLAVDTVQVNRERVHLTHEGRTETLSRGVQSTGFAGTHVDSFWIAAPDDPFRYCREESQGTPPPFELTVFASCGSP
jgi:hypothetical protein